MWESPRKILVGGRNGCFVNEYVGDLVTFCDWCCWCREMVGDNFIGFLLDGCLGALQVLPLTMEVSLDCDGAQRKLLLDKRAC